MPPAAPLAFEGLSQVDWEIGYGALYQAVFSDELCWGHWTCWDQSNLGSSSWSPLWFGIIRTTACCLLQSPHLGYSLSGVLGILDMKRPSSGGFHVSVFCSGIASQWGFSFDLGKIESPVSTGFNVLGCPEQDILLACYQEKWMELRGSWGRPGGCLG